MSFEETYFKNLYMPLARVDQKAMTLTFRKVFNSTVDDGGFTRGGTSFVITGPMAVCDAKSAFACLMRGNYAVGMLDARTITRRLDSKWIPRWTDADDTAVRDAECLIILDLFNADLIERMTPSEMADLVWFIQDSIANGCVIIAPVSEDVDLDALGTEFGQYIEQKFEVVHGPSPDTSAKTNATKKRNSKHGGDETAGKRTRKRIGKNA